MKGSCMHGTDRSFVGKSKICGTDEYGTATETKVCRML